MKYHIIPLSGSEMQKLDPIYAMRRHVNSAFTDAFDPKHWKDERFSPAVELHESPDSYTVCVELPGVDMADVNVTLTEDGLNIKGEKRRPQQDPKHILYRRTQYGTFDETIPLSLKVNEQQTSAEMKNGVLLVHVPKAEEVKPTSIPIKMSGADASSDTAGP